MYSFQSRHCVAAAFYATLFCASGFYASTIFADEMRVDRDRPYADTRHERQVLDVYWPASGEGRAVVVWIHGGGWKAGDKSQMQKKPKAFVEAGYVFVAPNRRFIPGASMRDVLADVAKSIRWAREHAKEYGGDPDAIFVMGHSSGANLAALVATDNRYLEAEGLSLSTIKGCVPLDGGLYDVPAQVAASASDAARTATYQELFGDVDDQRDLSPASHVGKGRKIPPFLIFHIDHPFTKTQSQEFAKKLRGAEVPAELYYAEDGKTHATLNSEIGLPDDKPTAAIFEFIERSMKRTGG
jgi:arylformamidase